MRLQRKLTRFVISAGLLASLAGVATLTTASADPVVSSLVASPSGSLGTIDVVNAPTSATVTVALDSLTCSSAFKVGQSYAITATSSDSTIASVGPSASGALNCGGTKGVQSQLFTVTAVCSGDATINFAPVAGPPGIQNKLAGTSVTVHVTNATGATCATPVTPPTGGANPAAPAVANAYLNANPDAVTACKAAFGNAKSWRGSTISGVAALMAKPESFKDTMSLDDWINYVVANYLDPTCKIPVV